MIGAARTHGGTLSRGASLRRSALPQSGRPGIARAGHTLQQAAAFLGSGLGGRWARLIEGPGSGKVLGNGLRELDRFLNVLLGEIADRHADAADARRLEGVRNTARKYAELCALLDAPAPAVGRLRAIGRSRDCLFHCGGLVRRADRRGGASMTVGWPAGAGVPNRVNRVTLGSRLPVTPEDLASVCRFYALLADDLLATSAARSTISPGAGAVSAVDRQSRPAPIPVASAV